MNELVTIPSLFIIISTLFAIEASTSLARIAGINTGSLASGLQLQSGLSLFSRALMAIFMPMLGFLADAGYYNRNNILIVYFSTLWMPFFLCILYFWRSKILKLYINSAFNLINKGSYFPIRFSRQNYNCLQNRSKKSKKFSAISKVTFFSYIPYYLTWPIIVMLLSYYPEKRGLIIGLSSVMNGVTTLVLVLYLDPLLIKLSKYKNISIVIYNEQLKIRILSAILSSLPFVAAGVYLVPTL